MMAAIHWATGGESDMGVIKRVKSSTRHGSRRRSSGGNDRCSIVLDVKAYRGEPILEADNSSRSLIDVVGDGMLSWHPDDSSGICIRCTPMSGDRDWRRPASLRRLIKTTLGAVI